MTSQQQAIEKEKGPCIILAGAGTGKSFTVIEKVNYLVNDAKEKILPEEILCLTFSNEATNSLRKRIIERLGAGREVAVKTFHSFCSDILKEKGHLIGIDEGFGILLPDDAKVLMHKYLDISPYWSNRYIGTISSAKDFGISLDDIKEFVEKLKQQVLQFCKEEDLEECAKEQILKMNTLHLNPQSTVDERRDIRNEKKAIKEFLVLYDEYSRFNDFINSWDGYDKLKNERNYQDFSDLNLNVLKLFRQFGYENDFKYVFVDEFQDTNKLQFELIEFIASHHNITVVGDPNQSVYGFRGAYKESFNHFEKAFGVTDNDIFKLDKSWRSPNSVLDVSYDLIKNNYSDENDCFKVQNIEDRTGDKVKVVELVKATEEARYIADMVEKAIEDGVAKNEICILHRTHRQSEVIKRALELKDIPVISAGKTNLMQKSEIRTTIAYLSILSNLVERTGTGEQAWWDLFHFHNTLSPLDSVKIGRYLKLKKDVSIDEALLSAAVDISSEGKKIVERVVYKLKELIKESNKALPELILDIFELSGLNRAFTFERSVANVESMMNLKRFYDIATSYYELHEKTLSGFIEYVEIIDSLGVNVEASKIVHIDAVRLMTIHAVKGLEYDVVIVSNMAEDRFPLKRTRNEPLIPKELLPDLKIEIDSWGDIDEKEKTKRIKNYEREMLLYEERRLCYVAFTRAKKNLVLTYSRSYDNSPDSTKESLFLDEIDYKNNCEYEKDEEELSAEIGPDSVFERYKSLLKNQIVKSLDIDKFDVLVGRLMNYLVCRDKKIDDFANLLNKVMIDSEELKRHLTKCTDNKSYLKFDATEFQFSPTSMLVYDECPKKYELSQLYHMPERGSFGFTSATTGSFVHKLFEDGVKRKFKTEKEYISLASNMVKLSEWQGVDMSDVTELVKVFFVRNSSKINDKSKVELKLPVEIDGFKFYGLADRIDVFDDGTIEIIDYKTNKNAIPPKKRAWQLGFYALAMQKMGYKVSRLTLDMLRLDKPVEMSVDDEGNCVDSGRGKGFNLNEVKGELIEVAKKIQHDYEHSFKPTDKDDNCKFCGYKFYCEKWGE